MTAERIGGIVLCGGQSRRMGSSKADLMFDGESLIVRTVKALSAVADPVIVAAAADQLLPALPADVRVVRDRALHAGPLAAFSNALSQLPDDIHWTFLVGCDLPLLSTQFLRFLAHQPRATQAIVPKVHDRWHPLAALYHCDVKPVAERLLAAGRRRMVDLLDAISATAIGADELAAIDPGLRSLRNANTPEEFTEALRESQSPSTVTPP